MAEIEFVMEELGGSAFKFLALVKWYLRIVFQTDLGTGLFPSWVYAVGMQPVVVFSIPVFDNAFGDGVSLPEGDEVSGSGLTPMR